MPLPFAAQPVRRRLLAWFRRHCRDLPWRRTRDPYAIWVSEIMLQQTQVATVVPYFERFLEAFPNVSSLARASERQVLRLWEGLGYYQRARSLHRAAQVLAAEHGGRCPDDADVWRALPGVGRYTLGAVLSQAFDRRLPILEANSVRVLCRLLGERRDPRSGPVQRRLWQVAETLLPRRHVGEFNQALMELGSQVCTPTSPCCDGCPLGTRCAARRLGLQDRVPKRAAAEDVEQIEEVAVVVRRREKVLLVQRPNYGRWAGLWEFPHGAISDGESHEQAARRLLPGLTGIHAQVGERLATIRHGITRFRITLYAYEGTYRVGHFRSSFYTQGDWLSLADLYHYPVSAPQRRIVDCVS